MKISTTDFDVIMLYVGKIEKLQLIPNLSCLDWLELITLLCAKKNFSEFSKNNEFINNTFSAKDFGATPYPKWKELARKTSKLFLRHRLQKSKQSASMLTQCWLHIETDIQVLLRSMIYDQIRKANIECPS